MNYYLTDEGNSILVEKKDKKFIHVHIKQYTIHMRKINVSAYLLLAFILLFGKNKAQAQLSPADSSFLLSVCIDPIYIDLVNYPGNWFINNPISNMSDFHLQIEQAYPFLNNQLLSAYDSIQIIGNQAYHDTILNSQIDLYNITLFCYGIL